jgi:hypothetical protein
VIEPRRRRAAPTWRASCPRVSRAAPSAFALCLPAAGAPRGPAVAARRPPGALCRAGLTGPPPPRSPYRCPPLAPREAARDALQHHRGDGRPRLVAQVVRARRLDGIEDWQAYLAPGEAATVMLIAADRRQARIALRYIRSLFLQHPTLAQLVTRETGEALELSCRVVIEVTTASFRTSRGYTVAAVIADELAYWIGDEDGANPADEILDALRPAMATLPGAMLMVATSPYARRGPVWEAWRKHFGQDGDILVWKAPTRRMNPLVPQATIDIAMERDPARAAAEWGAEFRTDVESFVSREVIEAAVSPGRRELPPVTGAHYVAFADPSGGSADSMTLAIAHRDDERAILDAVRDRRPPFSPDGAVEEFAALLRSYRVSKVSGVSGDRYAGDWPRERFFTATRCRC